MTAAPAEEDHATTKETDRPPCPIVGIGASAGGLEAFSQMLRALPVDTGMAFVLVQHLSPTHTSMLEEILSRVTAMPVAEVRDQAVVRANRVYVIPPDRDMIVSQGALKLLPRHESRGQHRPVDTFFRSLAVEQGHRAIGVILSGTGTDGTLGLEEIKAEGGIIFAQDDTAQHDSMPHSAVAAGCVDFVLPPGEIAREIARIARHPYVAPVGPADPGAPGSEASFSTILQILRNVTGVDFSQYRPNALHRRITRRMVLNQKDGVQAYARFLLNNAAEVEALYRDILISVTSFFRNPEAFDSLKARVLPRLFNDRSRNDPVRVWVAGCSTGEEAYSVAMTIAEFVTGPARDVPVQIFATDVNAASIDKARAGVYSRTAVHDVSPERLRRFFAESDGGYRLGKPIRDMCIFARHNLLVDPPFSRIDLMTCRNLLIYLEPALQQRIVPLLHYALKPTGFLWLGSSESISSYRDLFEVEDAKHKIFAKKPGVGRVTTGLPARPAPVTQGDFSRTPPPVRGADAQMEADRILLAKYAPPGVLVNGDLDILQFRGNTGQFLAPAPGKASLNLLKMAREGLLVALRAALHKAKTEHGPAREEGVRVKCNGGYQDVSLEVIPLKESLGQESCFLVLFGGGTGEGALPPRIVEPAEDAGAGQAGESAERQIARLTQELGTTREYLQSVIEQQEAANEELQSANEEVQSANEELQSTNEELETSKEEIQASNEELATVNDELQHRNQELGRANSDLVNLLGSVQTAIVMLGRDLRIRWFTPTAEKLLNLIATDVGRPMTDIKLNVNVPDFDRLVAEVIDTVAVKERDVQDKDGRWFSLRVRPYRTLDNRIDGAVLMLVDVDALKRTRDYAEALVATVHEPLLVLESDLRVRTASPAFYHTFQTTPAETEGRLVYELGDGQWNIPALRERLGAILPEDSTFDDFVVEHTFQHLGPRVMLLNARKVLQATSQSGLILLAVRDVTDHHRLEEALRARADELASADRSKDQFLAMLAHELRNPLASLHYAAQTLNTPGAESAALERARGVVDQQVRNMARMVDDLLDVSRFTRGNIQLRKEPVELATVLARAMESARGQIETRQQELVVSLPSQPIHLDADPTRLEQVFGNLLNNASKFNSRGGHIWVTAERARGGSPPGDGVIVRVRDDGIGIAAGMLPRVFDLFAQADRSLDRAHGGLGIGLTLVRALVELHGGSVQAGSAGVGKGSEFVVWLPVARAPDLARPSGDGAGGVPETQATRRRILVVDDELTAADTLADLLRLAGHDVRTVYDGPTALEAATSFQPEIVLLDIGIPGMDGYQVARELRRRCGAGAVPFLVALTGYGDDEYRVRSREAGFDMHLVKPVDLQVLKDLFARLPADVAGS